MNIIENNSINIIANKYKERGLLNETQITVVIETMVNFIDTISESFIKAEYPGDPVWILGELEKINQYSRNHALDHKKEGVKLIEKDLLSYLHKVRDYKNQPDWLLKITSDFYIPHQLCVGYFSILKLEKLQKCPVLMIKQWEEIHNIMSDTLNKAIQNIKKLNVYLEAQKNGHLYYVEIKETVDKENTGIKFFDEKNSLRKTPKSCFSIKPNILYSN